MNLQPASLASRSDEQPLLQAPELQGALLLGQLRPRPPHFIPLASWACTWFSRLRTQLRHNLTFPLQIMGDVSVTLGKPRWFELPQTKLGVRGTFRTLDRYSNRYQPEGVPEPPEQELYPAGLPDGREWEIRTYLHLVL